MANNLTHFIPDLRLTKNEERNYLEQTDSTVAVLHKHTHMHTNLHSLRVSEGRGRQEMPCMFCRSLDMHHHCV